MATRKNTRIDQKTRDKIKASQIINRLTKHVNNEDPETEVMSQSQIKAAEILLKKVLPDLKQIDIDGEVEHSGGIEITWVNGHAKAIPCDQ